MGVAVRVITPAKGHLTGPKRYHIVTLGGTNRYHRRYAADARTMEVSYDQSPRLCDRCIHRRDGLRCVIPAISCSGTSAWPTRVWKTPRRSGRSVAGLSRCQARPNGQWYERDFRMV